MGINRAELQITGEDRMKIKKGRTLFASLAEITTQTSQRHAEHEEGAPSIGTGIGLRLPDAEIVRHQP